MFLSFPGFHQPQLLKKARGKNQTSADIPGLHTPSSVLFRASGLQGFFTAVTAGVEMLRNGIEGLHSKLSVEKPVL